MAIVAVMVLGVELHAASDIPSDDTYEMETTR